MSDLKIIIANKTYSSWSLRGWLAVEHTGLPFEEIILELDTPSFYEEIVKYSPAKRVPTLLDGDAAVWDSAAIIDYCARISPEKFWWPTDRNAYAHARSIFNEMHAGFTDLRSHMPMNLAGKWSGLTTSEGVEKDIRRVEHIFKDCRARFGAGGDFLFGNFSATDMMYTPVASRLVTYGIALDPAAQAYVDAIHAYPAFKRWKAEATTENSVVAIDDLAADITHLG
ncbi:MAG: glutathione S-transferase family protein [Kordiimonadaceae bacterium]|nr:glutathione S-transferase family protein [Kordiimonadaceae bacterium]